MIVEIQVDAQIVVHGHSFTMLRVDAILIGNGQRAGRLQIQIDRVRKVIVSPTLDFDLAKLVDNIGTADT